MLAKRLLITDLKAHAAIHFRMQAQVSSFSGDLTSIAGDFFGRYPPIDYEDAPGKVLLDLAMARRQQWLGAKHSLLSDSQHLRDQVLDLPVIGQCSGCNLDRRSSMQGALRPSQMQRIDKRIRTVGQKSRVGLQGGTDVVWRCPLLLVWQKGRRNIAGRWRGRLARPCGALEV